ncbi:MAG: M23 family metallopeptidase [Candidatus Saccharibacteria bacterium]
MKARYFNILIAAVIAITSISINGKAFAYTQFYSDNNIIFYDPNDAGCGGYTSNDQALTASDTGVWNTTLTGPYNLEDYIVETLRNIALKLNVPEENVLTKEHVLALTAFGYGEGGNIANGWTYNLWNTGKRGEGLVTVDADGKEFSGNGNGTNGYSTFNMGVEASARTMVSNPYQSRLVNVLADKNSTAEDFMYTLTHFEKSTGNKFWAEASDENKDGIGDDAYYNSRLSLVNETRSDYANRASYLMGPPGYTSSNKRGGPFHSLTRPIRYTFEGSSSTVVVNLPDGSQDCGPDDGAVIGNTGDYGTVTVTSDNYAFPVVGVTDRGPYKPNHGNRDAADAYASPGTPVVAITNGTIENVKVSIISSGGRTRCAGKGVDASRDTFRLRGDDGYIYYYTHLTPNSTTAAGVTSGMQVNAGRVLGSIGPTGAADCTPPHLHISATPQTASDQVDVYNGDWLWKQLLPRL